MQKPSRSFWQIWNMSFGFLGIQFGWNLQMSNMSAMYEYLHAKHDEIPLLWLAAPLTGLLVQPIIGSLSDRTWGRLGRRRPYFLVGALLSSFALLLMPNCSSLWMAAGLLWILDASINVSMEPFRAFVTDLLPEEQRTRGFSMQSLLIGLGAVIASALPWALTHWFHVSGHGRTGLPDSVKVSFYVGAAAFLGAVLWTIVTTKEYPPDDWETFQHKKAQGYGIHAALKEVELATREMPLVMKRLAPVQLFTWLGLFCMWLYFSVAVARNVFGATDETSPLYQQGLEWAGLCFSMYSLVTFFFSFFLPRIADRVGRRTTHSLCLMAGAAGLISIGWIHDPKFLLFSMVGVGIAWASILSMPYVLLSTSLPENRTGVYMGIFNFFIVIPEILASLGFGWVMTHWLGNNRVAAVVVGGACFVIAAALVHRVPAAADGERKGRSSPASRRSAAAPLAPTKHSLRNDASLGAKRRLCFYRFSVYTLAHARSDLRP